MLKLLSFLFFLSFQAYGYQSIEDTLMYRCQNAALALGGYDEYHVTLTIDHSFALEEDKAEFEYFLDDYLTVKKIVETQNRTLLVVRAAHLENWSDVAVSLESYLSRKGFRGGCHLDL